MRTKTPAFLIAALLLASCALSALAEEISGIAWLMDLYGNAPSDEVLAQMPEIFAQETVDFGEITITFREVLCDGRWLYTSANAVANDSDAVLIVPGSAWLEDRVSGGYGEGLRDDDRTFIEAATQDEKRLLVVSVYPELLDDLPEYFRDHFQLDGGVSILLSGGMVSLEGETLKTNWRVRIHEVDAKTQEQVAETGLDILHALEARILTPTKSRQYRVAEGAGEQLPFETVTLLQTPLTVYTQPGWARLEDYYIYDYLLLDEGGEQYPVGASSEVYAFTMDELPDRLLMDLVRRNSEKAEVITIVLEAEEET